jgi:hypothetical protein
MIASAGRFESLNLVANSKSRELIVRWELVGFNDVTLILSIRVSIIAECMMVFNANDPWLYHGLQRGHGVGIVRKTTPGHEQFDQQRAFGPTGCSGGR